MVRKQQLVCIISSSSVLHHYFNKYYGSKQYNTNGQCILLCDILLNGMLLFYMANYSHY